MRAMVLREVGEPEKLRLEEVEVPRTGPGEALVKVKACGVCFHDVVVRNGTMRRAFRPPQILGHEIAGEVIEVGSEVTGVAVGDRVVNKLFTSCGHCKYCRSGRETHCATTRHIVEGGYAEYTAIPQECLVKVPQEIPLEQASIIGCAIGTVLHAVRAEAEVRAGEAVLVTGAGGGLGIHAVQVAKLCGGRVIAVTTSEHKVNKIKEVGADEVVLVRDQSFYQEVLKLTEGEGVDVVIDTVGSPVFLPSFRSLGVSGRYVFIGQVTGTPIQLNPAFIFFNSARLLGSSSFTRQELIDAVRFVQQGKIKPILSQTFPLEEAARVHHMLEDRRSVGRVALIP